MRPPHPDPDFVPMLKDAELRDLFAGMAMQGFLVCPTMRGEDIARDIARWSYEQADAMLKEREKCST